MSNEVAFTGQVEEITDMAKEMGKKTKVSGKTFRLWATKWRDGRPYFEEGAMPYFSVGDTVTITFRPRSDSYKGQDFTSNDVVSLSLSAPAPAQTSSTEKPEPDSWANLTTKDQSIIRMNATNNATALVAAQIQAGLLKENLPEIMETWFQFILNLLYHGPAITNKTETDIAMEAALAWAIQHNIDPQTLDKFIQGYKTNHNLTTLEVLTLINQAKFEVNEILDDIPF